MMKKAVIYSRVSTTEQTKGYGIETQVNGCKEYALRNDLEVIEIIQEDVSGATRLEERKGGLRLLELVNNGNVDTVIVWRLDRLSRPPQNEYSRLLTTYEQFANSGVELHSVETGKIDGPMGAMIVFFKSIGASEERAAIRDRTMKAKLAKAKSGKWVGNGRPSYGYRKVGKGPKAKLEIDEIEAPIVIRIFSMYLGINGQKKTPLRTIARILTQEGILSPGRSKGKGGAWYATTIYYRILSNDIYLGNVTYKGFTVHHPELALIDENIWLKTQEQLVKNKKNAKRNRKHDYLLTGHIRCSCGGAMNGTYLVNQKKKKYFYYHCGRKRIYSHIVACKEKSMRLDVVDDMVWQWVEGLLSDEAALEEGLLEMAKQAENELEPTKNRISTIDTILAKKERNLSRLLSAFGEEDDSIIRDALQNEIRETAHMIKSLGNERKGLEDKLNQTGITPEKQDWLREIARNVRSRLDNGGTYEDKRNLLDVLNFEATPGEKENGERFLEVKCWLGEDALLYTTDAGLALRQSARLPAKWSRPRPDSTRQSGRWRWPRFQTSGSRWRCWFGRRPGAA
ncbi:MAG: recombinase family protein [Anaerolineaceae bacterium]|nr:recombinase family protein [Anaerolineaceae bacterium]